jgi:hypothetical protein
MLKGFNSFVSVPRVQVHPDRQGIRKRHKVKLVLIRLVNKLCIRWGLLTRETRNNRESRGEICIDSALHLKLPNGLFDRGMMCLLHFESFDASIVFVSLPFRCTIN